MKRIDFLKSIAISIPIGIPIFLKKEEKPKISEPKMRPGDVAYYDGNKFHPISSAHLESASASFITYHPHNLSNKQCDIF